VCKPVSKVSEDDLLQFVEAGCRPVTLLVVISKVVEMTVDRRQRAHEALAISSRGHAYKLGKACETASLVVLSRVRQLMRERSGGQVLLCFSSDCESGFDLASHSRILTVMEELGVPLPYLLYTKSWLRARRTRYGANKLLGEPIKIVLGFAQGSVVSCGRFVDLMTAADRETTKNLLPLPGAQNSYSDDARLEIILPKNGLASWVRYVKEEIEEGALKQSLFWDLRSGNRSIFFLGLPFLFFQEIRGLINF
jgi:hypothetical protein